jgi:hypothetical protein
VLNENITLNENNEKNIKKLEKCYTLTTEIISLIEELRSNHNKEHKNLIKEKINVELTKGTNTSLIDKIWFKTFTNCLYFH